MGEIGIPRDQFYFGLRHWEIQAIIRGYRRRQRPNWEQARLAAFFIMTAQADLTKSNIYSDRDLIRFPWEAEIAEKDKPSDEEVEKFRKVLQAENAKSKKK